MKVPFIAMLLCVFSLSYGQFVEPKFGKVELSELTLARYDKDTSANALILFDNGYSHFELNNDFEFQFIYERHYRIKIFKKSAFSLGEVTIRLFQSSNGKEVLEGLKASTYNLVDGKIVKTKLDNDKVFLAEGGNYIEKKFAFPEIKEGSVIEVSYSIKSDFLYNFRGWKFQYNCPALWSQYNYVIPEYFIYRPSTKGYLPFSVNLNKKGTANYNTHTTGSFSGTDGSLAGSGRISAESTSLKPSTNEITLATSNVPAFISEPNIDCEDNYIQAIEFELSSVQYPNSYRKDYTRSWESVNETMNKDEDFGNLLKSDGFINDTVAYLCNNKQTEIEKAQSIYAYVQKRMKWDGNYRIWAMRGLKKPYANRVGNSTEINLLLTLMLQSAGLKAHPVMFSTRDNGIANTFYPTITKFNSTLTKVEIDGKSILLDATSKYCPFGVLPANDINGTGRLVNDASGDWVNLETNEKFREVSSYLLEISADGKFHGTIIDSRDGYAAISYRNNLSLEKNTDDYIRKIQENQTGLTISDYHIYNQNDNTKPVIDSLIVEITDHAESIGDKILFNPLLFESIEKNRYTLEDRKYPVDYNYPYSEVYNFDYTIPEGYQVESLPKSISLKLPDSSVSIMYVVQNTDNKIKVLYRRNINKILFLPEEYKNLKELYDQIVRKHSEQVILKKIV
jgi:hypothetical protein